MISHDFINSKSSQSFFYDLPSKPVQLKNLNFQKDLLSKDLIILQANESTVELLGYDFIDYALIELDKLNK